MLKDVLLSFIAWFGSRKTKAMFTAILAALSGWLAGAITPEMAVQLIVVAVVAYILGQSYEDAHKSA